MLDSPSRRKLIVAGPGTGKTFTFGRLLEKNGGGENLALTFIRKLVRDMEDELEGIAEAKTFHAYCKKLLHEKYGGVELFPALTQVVEEDAELLDRHLSHFANAFQNLDEEAEELSFYLRRGDYYRAVSFDDSVYRVLAVVREDKDFLPRYDQIVIDEFQDFNPLEVAFINELEQRGPILIVGDDDQAVYRLRNSSPDHLRDKFSSGSYDIYELPFCTRCPRVVVEATTAFISSIMEAGAFESRIDRPFVPYLEGKEYENERYPEIITATTSNILCSAKLVRLAIEKIPAEDIAEAHNENYPCVLIVGLRQYLNPLKKELTKHYSNVAFRQTKRVPYSLVDGYKLLLRDHHSNLGWRLLAGLELPKGNLKELVESSQDLSPMEEQLPKEFVERHKAIIDILDEPNLDDSGRNDLEGLLGVEAALVVGHFFPPEDQDEGELDLTKPSILLSSFEGCKGLSAGHVFVVGFNNGIMPRIDDNEIHDIEISKFIVAMTRTRKLLYLVSNRWNYAPRGDAFRPSEFIDYLPKESLLAAGYLRSPDVDTFIETVSNE
ncbi:MAG: UvrD-helicase domain-containing protein [Anaerolineales bacterium]